MPDAMHSCRACSLHHLLEALPVVTAKSVNAATRKRPSNPSRVVRQAVEEALIWLAQAPSGLTDCLPRHTVHGVDVSLRTAVIGPVLPHLGGSWRNWHVEDHVGFFAADIAARTIAPMAFDADDPDIAATLREHAPLHCRVLESYRVPEGLEGALHGGYARVVEAWARLGPLGVAPRRRRSDPRRAGRLDALRNASARLLPGVAMTPLGRSDFEGPEGLVRGSVAGRAGAAEWAYEALDVVHRAHARRAGMTRGGTTPSFAVGNYLARTTHCATLATGTRRPWETFRAALLTMVCPDRRCWAHPDCVESEPLGKACYDATVRPWIYPWLGGQAHALIPEVAPEAVTTILSWADRFDQLANDEPAWNCTEVQLFRDEPLPCTMVGARFHASSSEALLAAIRQHSDGMPSTWRYVVRVPFDSLHQGPRQIAQGRIRLAAVGAMFAEP